MLIYEKDNKLNINFENSVDGEPDLQIGKDGDKTEVLIDGQPGGGSGGAFIINATRGVFDNPVSYNDIISAISAGKNVVLRNVKADTAYYFSLKSAIDDGCSVVFDSEGYFYGAESPDNPLTLMQ